MFKAKSRPAFDRKLYAAAGTPNAASQQQLSNTMQSQNLMLISGTQLAVRTPLASSASTPLLASVNQLQRIRIAEALEQRQERIRQRAQENLRISVPKKKVIAVEEKTIAQTVVVVNSNKTRQPLQLPEEVLPVAIANIAVTAATTTVHRGGEDALKWDYRDSLREMTRAVTELEIVVEDQPPKKLARLLQNLFDTRNLIRAAMLKSHREERLAQLCDEMARCIQLLSNEKAFRQEFAFYQKRFDELLANCAALRRKREREAEGAQAEIFNSSQEC